VTHADRRRMRRRLRRTLSRGVASEIEPRRRSRLVYRGTRKPALTCALAPSTPNFGAHVGRNASQAPGHACAFEWREPRCTEGLLAVAALVDVHLRTQVFLSSRE
jgi:hypothetical protein